MSNIDAKDIRTNVKERMASILINKEVINQIQAQLILATISKERKGKLYKQALTDYLAEKLPITEENKTILNDAGYIMHQLSHQFSSEGEKESFYRECALCLLDAYGELTETEIKWQEVPVTSQGEYPRFEGCFFLSVGTQDYSDIALWLYESYDQKLFELTEQRQSSGESAKTKQKRTYRPFD